MSEVIDNEEFLPVQDELSALKNRADLLGIKYHPTISVAKLREKVNGEVVDSVVEAKVTTPEVESDNQRRIRIRREAGELVRIRVSCMNPAKKEWDGEIFSAGNGLVGSFTKYVPFNNDEGWHVPRIILNMMQERNCQIFVSSKDSRGNTIRKGKQIKEFAIEVLPNLTPEELQELAQRQAMAKSID